MKAIQTIEDLKQASSKDIHKALEQVTVLKDLQNYLEWLYSPEGTVTEGTFRLGFRQRGAGLHPSAFAKEDVCPLKLYYDCTGEIEPVRNFDFEAQITWDIGTLMHSMLQMHFLNMYQDQFAEEVWLRNKRLLITSHADGKFKFTKLRFILEIKSIKEGGNFGFAKVQARPFPDNVRQLMTYMKLDDCPFGLLLYLCKNTGEIKEHPITYNEEMWQSMRGKQLLPVVEAVKQREPPAPRVGYHCKRCDYYYACPHGKKGSQRHETRQSQRSLSRRAVLQR